MALAVTIWLYMTRLLTVRLVAALLAITALLQIFDLFNHARELLSRGGSLPDLLTYSALRLPLTVEQALPIAALIGILATLLALTRSNEIVALRSAGFTVYRLLGFGLPAMAFLALCHFLLIDAVTPSAERRFSEWWRSFDRATAADKARKAIWLRSTDAILRVRAIAPDGDSLLDVDIIQRSSDGVVRQWIAAGRAERSSAGWLLRDVRTTSLSDGDVTTRTEPSRGWPSVVDPASIARTAGATDSLSAAQLRDILHGTAAGEDSPAHYRTQLHRIYAVPLASLLMLLLAAPAAYVLGRGRSTGGGVALGFTLGMAYLVVDGLLAALGGAGAVPPVMAAWSPPALFVLVGASVLLHYEER